LGSYPSQISPTNSADEALIKNAAGQLDIPTVGQVGKMGVDVAEKGNRKTLANLSTVTEIDDVESYLVLLDEAGYSRLRHWAVQPDLLGQTLIEFVVNSSSTSMWLRQKRPGFDRQRVSRLIHGVVALSMERTTQNWAKLDDETLIVLTQLLQTQGKSIRFMLVIIRQLNELRDSKVPFDPRLAFGDPNQDGRGAEVGAYFDDVHSYLSKPSGGGEELDRLGASEHAWLLPYFEFLLDLSPEKKLMIASLICRVDLSLLERLTNVANFGIVLMNYALNIAFAERGMRNHPELPLGRFVDETMSFLGDRCFPALIRSGDRDFKDPYRIIQTALQSCSFAILNALLSREETPESRYRAIKALSVAREALEIAPDADELAKLERTLGALKLIDAQSEREAADTYWETLDRMKDYASPAEYTGTLVDFLGLSAQRGAFSSVKEGFDRIAQLPAELLVAKDIASVAEIISADVVSGGGDQTEKCRILVGICDFLQNLFSSEDAEL